MSVVDRITQLKLENSELKHKLVQQALDYERALADFKREQEKQVQENTAMLVNAERENWKTDMKNLMDGYDVKLAKAEKNYNRLLVEQKERFDGELEYLKSSYETNMKHLRESNEKLILSAKDAEKRCDEWQTRLNQYIKDNLK